MNNDIKEILDLLNYNKEAILNRVCCIEDFISREQTIKLLDYITNLEEALDKEITAKKKAIEELKEKISYLMPYEIYKNEVEQIGNEVINILEGNEIKEFIKEYNIPIKKIIEEGTEIMRKELL